MVNMTGARIELVALSVRMSKELLQPDLILPGFSIHPEFPSISFKVHLPFYIEAQEQGKPLMEYGLWLVKLRDTGRFIGEVVIKQSYEANSVEVGYLIFLPYRRQGYATEVVFTLKNWLYLKCIKKIIASCDISNRPSQRVLEKNNFVVKEKNHEIITYERRVRNDI